MLERLVRPSFVSTGVCFLDIVIHSNGNYQQQPFHLHSTDAEQARYHYLLSETNSTNSTGSSTYFLTHNISGRTRKEDLYPTQFYANVYTTLVLSILIFGLIRSLVHTAISLRSSVVLHNRAFNAVVRTSLRFFTTNPSGSILNRFSQDVSIIDEILPRNLMESLQVLMIPLGSAIVACTVNAMIVLPTLIVFALCYWVNIIFSATSKHTKQLEGKSK